jgi:erythromycin esterase-like protein
MIDAALGNDALAAVRRAARPMTGDAHDHDALLDLIGDAEVVLLGEASHGTHEFYRERARITRRLIEEKGFAAVAVEADWPDAYRVNRFVQGRPADADAAEALSGFRRFPTWMWANTVVAAFVDWLREHNRQQPPGRSCGFYGLDLYSLHGSIGAVLEHLERTDPALARRARERYGCFDRFGEDSRVYGLMTGPGSTPGCEDEVVAMLVELARRRKEAGAAHDRGERSGDAAPDPEDAFDAEQNARLVKNAERYYRTMHLSDVSSWNLRDDHMMETLMALREHLARRPGRSPRIVVWAHNSHLGDARATEMGEYRREINLGQRVRERYGEKAVLVGFTTHEGTVTAATDWDAPGERKRVQPSLPDSLEGLMHSAGLARFLLPLRGDEALAKALREPRLQRAIGVIYRPETERQSHYFHARVARQFDALVHLDVTRAVEPLVPEAGWLQARQRDPEHEGDSRGPGRSRASEPPETYPSGL